MTGRKSRSTFSWTRWWLALDDAGSTNEGSYYRPERETSEELSSILGMDRVGEDHPGASFPFEWDGEEYSGTKTQWMMACVAKTLANHLRFDPITPLAPKAADKAAEWRHFRESIEALLTILSDVADTGFGSDLKAKRDSLSPEIARQWPVLPERRPGGFFQPTWEQNLKDELQRWQLAAATMEAELSAAGKENRGAKPRYLGWTVKELCEHFDTFYVPHDSNRSIDRINFIVTALDSARIAHPDDERLTNNYIRPALRAMKEKQQENAQK